MGKGRLIGDLVMMLDVHPGASARPTRGRVLDPGGRPSYAAVGAVAIVLAALYALRLISAISTAARKRQPRTRGDP
jgi:hypothetical protein